MTLARPATDYTTKDFDSIRERLFNVIPSVFPEWTDTQTANYGNLLVELFAYVLDVLSFYQDNQAQESRWSTARLRRSLLSMAKLTGYKPTGAAAATAELTIRLAAPPLGPVTIGAGDTFSTQDIASPVVFQALAAVTIPAGSDPPVAFVAVENSKAASDLYLSSGLPNQTFVLNGVPFLDNSLTITADNGAYVRVEDFLASTEADRHYTVAVDENSRASVTFGNSIAGAIPQGNMTLSYKTGGGSGGNVGPDTIVRASKSYSDSFGNAAPVLRVSNASRASGGTERMTVEAIREAAPRSLRALTRTICREDYEINARHVAGVARALMLTRDELGSIPENQGILYIVPKGGGVATQPLQDLVSDELTKKYPKGITFKLTVLSARYLTVDVSTRIHLQKGLTGANALLTVALVKKAVADFFAIAAADGSDNADMDFGYYLDGAIAWSDVFDAIRDVRGVRKIDDGLGNLQLNGEADDVVVTPFQFPTLGTVTVIDAVTGVAL